MFGRRWTLFRLHGIPVSLDASWLVILALLTLSIGGALPELMHKYFAGAAPITPAQYWLLGLIAALAFFGCILLHELGHAIVGRSRGMAIGGITLFLFGGVAELEEEPASAATEFLMAIAGPLVSVLLGVVCGLLAWVGYHGGWWPPAVILLGYLGAVNFVVLAFNLIPAFPLDGGRVLRSILWAITGNLQRATRWAATLGQLFAWLLIAWGVVNFFAGNWLGGIWMGLIGMFLNSAAQSSYQQVLIRGALQGEPVRRFMNPRPIIVPPTLDLGHWVEEYVYRFHLKTFPVGSLEHIDGFITTQALSQVPREAWPLHTVGEAMIRDIGPFTIAPDADAAVALAQMRQTGAGRLLVMDQDRLVGVISLKDLLQFLSLKLELEGDDGANGRPPSAPAAAGTGSITSHR
jgi:Zn-dependent protease/CBS domain-containing protein